MSLLIFQKLFFMQRLKIWARALKRDVMTLWFALKHPDTPWYARAFAAVITAYALSPIDLIPDFIPILGYLDDLIIVPFGVWLLLKIVPEHVLTDSRAESDRWLLERKEKPQSYVGLVIILGLWGVAGWAMLRWFVQ
ncbi:YkvA family protein [Nitrosomonas supralitoralis]|nr:YkvA family protein [Nitrosomonas supralitoralis]